MTTEEELKEILKADLKKLVSLYAKWDPEKKVYLPEILDKPALLKLGDQFYKLLDAQLLADGADDASKTKRNKKLALFFHTDKKNFFLPEVIWLEANFSEGKNDGGCFKMLAERYQKLTTPEKVQAVSFDKIKTKKEFRNWLEHLQTNSSSFTYRSFCSSLLDLFDQSNGFFDEVGKIKPKGLKTLIRFIPVVFASYGAIICGQELFALYALYFVLLKGGQKVEQIDFTGAPELGKTLQGLGKVGAAVTAVFVMRLLEMTFWISHRSFKVSLQIGATIITPLLAATTKPSSHSKESRCTDLILSKQDTSIGTEYKTPELKLISAPLEAYLALNAEQTLVSWRAGNGKQLAVTAFLFNLRVIDKLNLSLQDKLISAQKELKKLMVKGIYDGKTKAAVDIATNVIDSLLAPDAPSTQLVVVAQPAAKTL